jgi:hypothetical protein
VSAAASLYALRGEHDALIKQLSAATRNVLGKPVDNPRRVSRTLKTGARPKGSDIPGTTASDILALISQKVPNGEKIKLDITRLDIKPGKTYLKGTADSRGAIGSVVEALKQETCFEEVSSGTIAEVSGGKKEFTLTMQTRCF